MAQPRRRDSQPARDPASAGRRDDWYFHWGHRILHEAWTDANIPHVHREHRRTHESRFYEAHAEAVEWLGETLVTRE
jgi:hypothetical protein